MKREVARAVSACLFQPKLKRFQRAVRARWANHFDKCRRPADDRGAARRFMIYLRRCAHERQIDVNMRIDETGEDILPGCIDYFRILRRLDVGLNPCDRFSVAKDIRHVLFVRRNDLAVFDEQTHKRNNFSCGNCFAVKSSSAVASPLACSSA